ncbi:MAG: hypothetical protein V4642_11545 [Bacteroidota bacterium]
MNFLKVFFLSCVSTVILSCGENSTEPANTGQLLPSEAGNYFNYDNSFYEPDGTIREVVRDTVIVSSLTMKFDNEHWFGLQYYFSNSSTRIIDTDFWLNKTDGLWQRGGPYGGASHIAKFPAQAGERFLKTRDTSYGGTVLETFRKVISTNTSITVPAGTFAVHVYKDETGGASSILKTDYYAPGRGLIKSEIYGLDGKLLRVSELAEFGKK